MQRVQVRRSWKALFGATIVALLVAAGCGDDDSDEADAHDLRFIMVTHAQRSDPFWESIANGLDQAGEDLGVSVEYRGPQGNLEDPNAQRQLIENAIAAAPDGMIVTNPTPDALNPAIEAIRDAGIPFIVVNAGDEFAAEQGALAYIGNDEFASGEVAAKELAKRGSEKALIITIPPGILPLADNRVNGFKRGFGSNTVDAVVPLDDIGDATKIRNIVLAELEQDDEIDSVFSLGSALSPAMLAARDALGQRGESILWSTIDLGDPVTSGIRDGSVEFALYQQEYLQGYLPVVYLALFLRYQLTPASDLIATGPGLVTAQNIDAIAPIETEE